MLQPYTNRLQRILSKLTWPLVAVGASLLSIALFFLLQMLKTGLPELPLLCVIGIGGLPLFVQILLKLAKGDLGADALAAIALVTAVVLGQYLAATLLVLMLASGQALEAYAVRKASSALLALVERMPAGAHRLVGGRIEETLLDALCVGDTVVVYPHETCPVDGIVVEGHGSMDESYLTGEPYQLSKAPGASVLSGAINGASVLTVRAERLPTDSRYAAIVQVLQEAEQKRPAIRRLGDQLGAFFAPAALLLAGYAWYATHDAMRFLAVLVIATPCPLLIAIPITIISAISMAAKKGIIIKDPSVLEALPTCRTAIFDKTGTLTYGKPVLTETKTAPLFDENLILQLAASLERYSKHPLASAILTAAATRHLPLLEVLQVTEKPGQGLSGVIRNRSILITHRKRLLEEQPAIAAKLPASVGGLECIVLCDDEYAATLSFRDQPRADSQSFIGHLGSLHLFKKVMLVSGDRESEVKYLGDLLNLTDVYASQSPEEKLAIVRNEKAKAATLFMGDGINDAPALTAATVGVAFGQHSNIAAEAAGAVILGNTLREVDVLLHLSIATRTIILQSALGGMVLSCIGMGFAAAGFISPVSGALLQEFIDVFAILSALRLVWGKEIRLDLPE